MQVDLRVFRRWNGDGDLLLAAWNLFAFAPGDDRATGYVYAEGEQDWPSAFATVGPTMLDDLKDLLGVRFTIVAFQAYRNGAGCDWHTDDAFDSQAVLSLGATRTFGVRRSGGEPTWMRVNHGDLVFMPPGFQTEWQHCVPVEKDATGERCSLVFRTKG